MTDPLQEIMEERARQDQKWGEQNHDNLYWLGILIEEIGEVSRQIIEDKSIRKELVQVAAVALAWLECLERRKQAIYIRSDADTWNSLLAEKDMLE